MNVVDVVVETDFIVFVDTAAAFDTAVAGYTTAAIAVVKTMFLFC